MWGREGVIFEIYREVGKGVGKGGEGFEISKRICKRERGPEERGSDGWKIYQRGKTAKRLRRVCGVCVCVLI